MNLTIFNFKQIEQLLKSYLWAIQLSLLPYTRILSLIHFRKKKKMNDESGFHNNTVLVNPFDRDNHVVKIWYFDSPSWSNIIMASKTDHKFGDTSV